LFTRVVTGEVCPLCIEYNTKLSCTHGCDSHTRPARTRLTLTQPPSTHGCDSHNRPPRTSMTLTQPSCTHGCDSHNPTARTLLNFLPPTPIQTLHSPELPHQPAQSFARHFFLFIQSKVYKHLHWSVCRTGTWYNHLSRKVGACHSIRSSNSISRFVSH
jgi:hypothetical protein